MVAAIDMSVHGEASTIGVLGSHKIDFAGSSSCKPEGDHGREMSGSSLIFI